MDRVFLDANVLFSLAYQKESHLRQLLKLRGVTFVTSAYAVEEARRNLSTTQQLNELEQMCASMELVGSSPSESAHAGLGLSDPRVLTVEVDKGRFVMVDINLPESDRPILAAAIQARATHLLTGDVRHFGPYYDQTIEGVLILPPARYVRMRRSQSE